MDFPPKALAYQGMAELVQGFYQHQPEIQQRQVVKGEQRL